MEENETKKEITLDDVVKLITETKKDLVGQIAETKKDLVGQIAETKKDLTMSIDETRVSLEKKIDSVQESLAASTQKEFLSNREYVDKKFNKVDRQFEEVNSKINNLDLVVKNKHVDNVRHKELENRVEKLEEKSKQYDTLLPQAA